MSNIALALLSLPLSSASVERVFSEMNWAKNKARNRLLVEDTKKLLLVKVCLLNVRVHGTKCVPSPSMLGRFDSSIYKGNNNEEIAFVNLNDDDDEHKGG